MIAECGIRNAEWTDSSRCKGLFNCGFRIADCGMKELYNVQGATFKVQGFFECGVRTARVTK